MRSSSPASSPRPSNSASSEDNGWTLWASTALVAFLWVASLVAACQRAGGGATPAPVMVVRPSAAVPLEVGASTALVRTREHPEYGPLAETRVMLRNVGAVPLRLTLRTPCTVFVRVFSTPARTEPHAWSLGREPGGL